MKFYARKSAKVKNMKFVFYISLFFTLTFARTLDCAYSASAEETAVLSEDSVKIYNSNLNGAKTIKQDAVISLAYRKGEILLGTRYGGVIKLNEQNPANSSEIILGGENLAEISRVFWADGKIYAVLGRNTLAIYDEASRKVTRKSFGQIYRIAACIKLKDALIIAGWDGLVYRADANLRAAELFKLPSAPLTARYVAAIDDAVFGLADGRVATLKDKKTFKISNAAITAVASADENLGADGENAVIYFASADGAIYKTDKNFKILASKRAADDKISGLFLTKNGLFSVDFNGKASVTEKF